MIFKHFCLPNADRRTSVVDMACLKRERQGVVVGLRERKTIMEKNKNSMILLIDTTKEHLEKQMTEELLQRGKNQTEFELIDTAGMHISHCMGCNYCWLKTPGICVIKDDYEPILKKMSKATQVWFISDIQFGFLSYQTKDIVDRVMPLVTMHLEFKGGQMRHVMRYEHQPDFGIVYNGEGNQDYLNRWCQRMALNFGSSSLGAFPREHMKEAVLCTL